MALAGAAPMTLYLIAVVYSVCKTAPRDFRGEVESSPSTSGSESVWRALARTVPVAAYLVSAYYLVHEVVPRYFRGDMNVYVVQPLIWSGLGAIAFWYWWRLPDRPRFSRGLVGLAAVAGVFQLAIMATAGVLYGFGHSTHFGNALNMAKNGIYFGTMVLGFEMSRAYLVHTWSRANAFAGFGVVALLFTAVAVPPGYYPFSGGDERTFEVLGGEFLPTASESVLATFLASIGGPAPAFTYRFILASFDWYSPILPNLEWSATAFVATLAPVLAMLVIRDIYLANRSEEEEDEGDGSGVSPLWMLATMVVVGLIWLNTGLLGVRPDMVSGHSMDPAFETGDIVITREVRPESLDVGDVIRFRKGNVAIVHRIVEIGEGQTGPVFITRGDSNNTNDEPIVAEQLEGKVVLVIPEAAWPVIFVRNLLARLP